jgi:hypothetical protein
MILLLAVVVRLVFVALVPAEPKGDAYIYSEAAKRMADGQDYTRHGEPSALFPVGWPGALAIIYLVSDDSRVAAQLMNIVSAVITIFAAYHIARHVFAPLAQTSRSSSPDTKPVHEIIALTIALLLALYPNHIAYTALLFTEPFFTALLMAGVALLLQRRWWLDLLSAIIFAVAVLTKPQVLIIPMVVLIWRHYSTNPVPHQADMHTLRRAALIYSVIFVLLMPWLYRNHTVFNAVVFVSTNGGFNLYLGNNPQAEGFYRTTPQIWEAIGDEDEPGPASELSRDRTARRLAIEYITEHPERMPGLALRKGLGMYRDNTEAIGWASNGATIDIMPLRPLTRGLYAALWILAAGFPLLYRRYGYKGQVNHIALPALIVVYFTVVTMVFFADERFSAPVVPFVFMYSVASLILLGQHRLHSGDTADN